MAHQVDGFQCHVAGVLNGPLVVLLEEDGADQADDGSSLWKMATSACETEFKRGKSAPVMFLVSHLDLTDGFRKFTAHHVAGQAIPSARSDVAKKISAPLPPRLNTGQSLTGAKLRNPSKAALEADFRNPTKNFAPPRRESSHPVPFPPPFSPSANLSPRSSNVENPQYLRASWREAADRRISQEAEFRLSVPRILQSS